MESLTYNAIKTANVIREIDEQKTENRKKNILVLILQYLYEEGFIDSAKSLEVETSLILNRFEVCDNINLETILLDFEAYYHIKFNRYPKIIKKNFEDISYKNISKFNKKRSNIKKTLPKLLLQSKQNFNLNETFLNSQDSMKINNTFNQINNNNNNTDCGIVKNSPMVNNFFPLSIDTIKNKSDLNINNNCPSICLRGKTVADIKVIHTDDAKGIRVEENIEDKLIKPMGGFIGYNSEWKELAQIISKDIFLQNPNVKWADIIGLEKAKHLVKESIVYPIKYPQLFKGILSPWKGLLLYGPPGTGKTLLAKAIATECKTTFFNISASSIVSKWRGDSEKLIRVLFELARFHAPSTIFLDEIDALMSQRGGSGSSEHEGSRRMKTELLIQLDGLAKTSDLVFLLAASNLPWELDYAMLRRLEKRIFVNLPTLEARKSMFQHHLPPIVCSENKGILLKSDLNYEELAELSEGYSGSDIYLVSKEAAMKSLRKVFAFLENHTIENELNIHLDTITTDDAREALINTKPSASNLLAKYLAWQEKYESV